MLGGTLRLLFHFLFLFIFSVTAHAYSSVTVPIEDPVYRRLDKLASFGLIKTMIRGQRPYVRSEIARLIAEAMEQYPAFAARYRENPEMPLKESERRFVAKAYVDRILDHLKAAYQDELVQRGAVSGEIPRFQGKVVESLSVDYLYLDENKETIPPDNGLGGIAGILQPLVEDRGGRHYQNGHNWALESHHWARLGKYFSLQAQPRFQAQIAKAPLEDETKLFVQRLNGRFTFNKLDLEVGRDSINWGPARTGGITFSNNPRPLDMIKVSSISPFLFPYFFKKLGPHEMSLVVANLGPEQNFKDPWLVAYKISSRRNEFFEFSLTQQMEVGGEGAPEVGLGQGLADFFFWGENGDRVNRQVSFEFLGHIPQARGLELYAEFLFGDFTSNLETLLIDNTSYLGGVFVPRLDDAGMIELRLEYRRLAPRYSRSALFTSGMTENNLLIGDPLGPDSHGVLLEGNYEINPHNLLLFAFQYSHFNDKRYDVDGNSVAEVADLGEQSRFLYRLAWRRLFNRHFVGNLGMGIEQVRNTGFIPGNDAVYWLGEAGFTYYFSPVADL